MLTLHTFGDDSFHGLCTSDGVVVSRNEQQQWCYATLTAKGLLSSGIVAHNMENRSFTETLQANECRQKTINYLSQPIFQKGSFASNGSAVIKATGSPCIPVVLVEFSDIKFLEECDSTFFVKHFNTSNYKENGYYGSVRDYFIAQSDSIFCPSFHILGTVTLSKNRKSYGGNISGNDRDDRGMMEEALDSLLVRNVDFSPYVTTNSRIPLVCFIYAGRGEQTDGPDESIWAKCYTEAKYKFSNYNIEALLCTNESADYEETGTDHPDGIGTFVHEFSHTLGLPDFYATNGLSNNFGLDYWDIMDWGQFIENGKRPVGYSAYERMFMGWLNPTILDIKKQSVELSPLTGNEGIRSIKIVNEANNFEYLMLENRTESTWFSPYYGEGMLVYHVDYSSSSWMNNTVNTVANHQRMSILCADNMATPYWRLINNQYVYATEEDYKGDLYPGLTNNTEITDTSTPAAKAFTNDYFHCSLTDIKRLENGNIYFVYMDDGIEGIKNITTQEENPLVEVYNLQGMYLGQCHVKEIKKNHGRGIYILKNIKNNKTLKTRL